MMAFTHSDYTVGWISAIPLELATATAMMDKLHSDLEQDAQDTNAYTLGQIGKHNVVVAISARTGIGAAAHAAANLLRSFPNIRFGLMVGIGGGVPEVTNSTPDIRLGDVVVSYPKERHSGVVQYDFGTEIQEDGGSHFERKGSLNKPPSVLLSALRKLQANAMRGPLTIQRHYEDMMRNNPTMECLRPERDELYSSEYLHHGKKGDCSQCDKEELITTSIPRTTSIVHYGLIGSGNTLLKSAITRDRLRKEEGILCVEMEAAGLMDEFSCVVIRGISDYCDSHKSDQWQGYSSAIAAAYAKELLLIIAQGSVNNLPRLGPLVDLLREQVHETKQTNRALGDLTSELSCIRNAAARTQHTKYLEDLNCMDPRFDKAQLEDIKGGLLRDAYEWVLQTSEYTSWKSTGGLLWIKGDPGKGKTMLMCGIIDELKKHDKIYFFCQATRITNNSATSVLKGLIFAALQGDTSLGEALSSKITQAGTVPQESAFYIYSDIVNEILKSKNFIILVDALDECLSGRDTLLRFIVKCSATYSSSQWLVTSRNVSEIDEHLGHASRLSLELNEDFVLNAVDFFVKHKVQKLAQAKKYDAELQAFVLRYLLDNAQGTFLWVSLVCERLLAVRTYLVREELLRYPAGLVSVYKRMLSMIEKAEGTDKLKQILSLICITFRPMTLDELGSLIDLSMEHVSHLEDMVNDCGSFLTIRKSTATVEFVHQSAKDFLVDQGLFSRKKIDLHHQAFTKSLATLQSLRRNMYSLKDPGASLDDINDPDPTLLKDIRYAGQYWVDHLLEVYDLSPEGISPADVDLISSFLETKVLYWLELLSLLGQVYPITSTLLKLQSIFQLRHRPEQFLLPGTSLPDTSRLEALVNDLVHFLRYFQYALAQFPLQVYVSGLLFCPSQSLIKSLFRHEAPTWVSIEKGIEDSWPDHLTLDSASWTKCWSNNAKMLAARPRGDGQRISVWDAESGQRLTILSETSQECAFTSSDTELLAIDEHCVTIRLWAIKSGELLDTRPLRDSAFPIDAVDDFSPRNDYISTISNASSLVAHGRSWLPWVEIHCTSSGSLVHKITLEEDQLKRLAFDVNGFLLAIETQNSVRILDVESGEYLWSKSSSDSRYHLIAFSVCSTMLALAKPDDESIDFEIWDWQRDTLLWTLPAIHKPTWAIRHRLAFLKDRILVANDNELKEWNLKPPHKYRIRASLDTPAVAMHVDPRGRKIAIRDLVNVKIRPLNIDSDMVSDIDDVRDISVLIRVWLKGKFAYTASESDVARIRRVPIVVEEISDTISYTLETGVIDSDSSISPNQSDVAIWCDNTHGLEIWNLDQANRVLRIDPRDNGIEGIAWGPGETRLTVARYSNRLECWSITEDRMVRQLPYIPTDEPPHKDFDVALLWSSKGCYLLISRELGLYLWIEAQERWCNVGEGKDFYCMDSCMVFSDDESLFACITYTKDLMIFKTDTQGMLSSIPGHGKSSLLVFESHWLKTDKAWYAVPYGFTESEAVIKQSAEHLNIEADEKKDRSWLRSGTDNIIWLPPEYRPSSKCWDIDGSKVAIGKNSLQVAILDVRWDRSRGQDSQGLEGGPASNHKRRRSSLVMDLHRKKNRRIS